MQLNILLIIILTSFVQSIFGVGVLLFGTPLLLLSGHDFIDAIKILLPISLSINLIQIVKDYKNIDLDFYKKILVYTIPFVVLFLFFVTSFRINITIFIGIFLLLVAAKDYSTGANKIIKYLIDYEKTYFVAMGIIHGITNLGGSLLTAIVHGRGYVKNKARVTVALSYATFAIFQMLTLAISGNMAVSDFGKIGIYAAVGISVFLFTELLVYIEINNANYARYFAVLLFFTGMLLCLKSF